jgi:nitroimidazol reductase NimA-like FMN-containing flavoprotein (pyridoxamine 5'-phosphate oxidase superfamily)
MQALTPTEHIRRHVERGVYDMEEIYSILDEGYVCDLGFVVDGQPYGIPTAYGRSGSQIYIHGCTASRTVCSLGEGIDAGVTVTLVDGFVLARSAFRHSINYRSVVILGRARLVTDAGEKIDGLRCLTDHVVPGRWEEVRPPNKTEIIKTSVLALRLDEVSAKVRSGPPLDPEEDHALPVWAGVVPIRIQVGEPVPDAHVLSGISTVDTRSFHRIQKAERAAQI